MLARSFKHRLTRLLLGQEHQDLAYWNAYNDSISEAIHMAAEEERRVTNFIKDHDGPSLDTEKGKSLFINALYGVREGKNQSKPDA